MRLIAHETQEPKLIRAFREGGDIHSDLCFFATGHRPVDVDERKIWKTVGFARVYGAGLPKIVYLTGLPFKDARDLFRRTEGIYPAIDDYKNDLLRELLENQIIKIYNVFGRYRFIGANQFKGATLQDRARNALREAFNWIFQSSGHDVLKIWLMETIDTIADPKVLLINDVHDEFVLDVPENKVEDVKKVIIGTSALLNDILYQAYGVRMRIPIIAEYEHGPYWK
jgi:DNA polymerase-1